MAMEKLHGKSWSPRCSDSEPGWAVAVADPVVVGDRAAVAIDPGATSRGDRRWKSESLIDPGLLLTALPRRACRKH